MELPKTIGILGGGISAASLAYFLPKKKYNITILEKEDTIGGLARSFVKSGFIFDIGPHIIFAKDKKILHWMVQMLGKNKRKLYRRCFVYYKDRYVKYPFENGLGQLPKKDAYECLYHFLNNDFKGTPKNFKEWMYCVFGKGIAEKYLIPYNKKIWKRDPKELTLEWVGGRVPHPPREDIIKSAMGIETEGYLHQLYFYYPRRGGAQILTSNILKSAKKEKGNALTVSKHFEIQSIFQRRGKWVVVGGINQKKEFDILINTMPIHELMRRSLFLPRRVKENIKKLHYNSLVLVRLGFRGNLAKDKFTVYFPEPDTLFHRITFNDYISPHMSPPGMSSLLAEIVVREGDALSKMSDKKFIQHTLNALEKKKIARKKDVVFSDVHRVQYEYPVYDKNYSQYRNRVFGRLGSIPDFYSCGRFAEFRYINMNDCIQSAMHIAKRLS